MNIEPARNFDGISACNPAKTPTDKTPKDNLSHFNTIEYTSKNDGKTYIAKKLTLKQNDKEVTGIYVYDKTAKPDQNGKIPGVLMSYDTFMKQLANELLTVDSNLMTSYYPNINKTASQKNSVDLTKSMQNGVELSNGSILLQRHLQGGASHNIEKNEDGTYTVKSTPISYGAEAKIEILSEDELKSSNAYFGSIKESDDGTIAVEYKDNQGKSNEKVFNNLFEAASFLDENSIYVVQ